LVSWGVDDLEELLAVIERYKETFKRKERLLKPYRDKKERQKIYL
jgi:hypothetical protein